MPTYTEFRVSRVAEPHLQELARLLRTVDPTIGVTYPFAPGVIRIKRSADTDWTPDELARIRAIISSCPAIGDMPETDTARALKTRLDALEAEIKTLRERGPTR